MNIIIYNSDKCFDDNIMGYCDSDWGEFFWLGVLGRFV